MKRIINIYLYRIEKFSDGYGSVWHDTMPDKCHWNCLFLKKNVFGSCSPQCLSSFLYPGCTVSGNTEPPPSLHERTLKKIRQKNFRYKEGRKVSTVFSYISRKKILRYPWLFLRREHIISEPSAVSQACLPRLENSIFSAQAWGWVEPLWMGGLG